MSKYTGYTDKQNKATQKYIKENLEQISFRVAKGKKEEYQAQAAAKGKSLTAYIVELIERDREQ